VTSGMMSSSSRSSWPPGELHPPAQLPQRDADRVPGGVARARPQGRDRLGQGGGRVPGKPGPQVIRAVTISARAWLIVWVSSDRAVRLAIISARIASTEPSRPFGAPAARPDCGHGRR